MQTKISKRIFVVRKGWSSNPGPLRSQRLTTVLRYTDYTLHQPISKTSLGLAKQPVMEHIRKHDILLHSSAGWTSAPPANTRPHQPLSSNFSHGVSSGFGNWKNTGDSAKSGNRMKPRIREGGDSGNGFRLARFPESRVCNFLNHVKAVT